MTISCLGTLHLPFLILACTTLPSRDCPRKALDTIRPHRQLHAVLATGSRTLQLQSPITRQLQMSDLDSVVGVWTGSSVFAEVVPPIVSSGRASKEDPSPLPIKNGPTTPHAGPSGSSSSPISIHSTPSPLHRPRGKAICSHLAGEAFNAPRPARQLVTFADPPRFTYTGQDIPQPRPHPRKPEHPFFSRTIHRAHSAPLRVPRPNRPRLVAHYSSTSASTSQHTNTQSTTQSSYNHGRGKRNDVWSIDGFDIELDNYIVPSRESDEASEEEETLEMHVAADQIRELAESLESMVLPKSAPGPASKPVSIPRTRTHVPSTKGKMKNPGLPEYDHSSYSPRPKVAYTTNADEANDLLSCLKGEVLGFDMEWPTIGQSDQQGRMIGRKWNAAKRVYEYRQPKTALLQFCDEEMIVMVHIWHMDRVPEKAVEIMANSNIYKTGVAISNDGKKLLRDYPESFPDGIASLLELSHMARRVDPVNTGPGRTLIALAKLVGTYLGKYLDKSRDLRAGNWTLPLSDAAADYAANDVHAGLYLYHALCDMGYQSDIEVDLAELALHLPPPGQAVYKLAKPVDPLEENQQPEPIPEVTAKPLKEYAPIKSDDGKTLVSAVKVRAVEMYKTGMTTVEVAEERRVRTTTIQGYILDALPHLPPDTLDISDKKRLVDELEAEGSERTFWHRKALQRPRDEIEAYETDTEP